VQIPKIIRSEFKLEPNQILIVGFSVQIQFRGWRFFYAKMKNAGKMFIPKEILSNWYEEKSNLPGCTVELTLEPA
jgi:hypothetical protein